jgi:hypothetical protein
MSSLTLNNTWQAAQPLPFMIEGLSVTTDISFFIICSASMRDLSSNLANYKRHNHREAKKSYNN